MKILHLLTSNTYSGAENVVCQIIKMFTKDDDIQMVYCSPEGPIRESLKSKNIEFVSLKKISYRSLKKIVDIYKPDVIHAHDIRASILASLLNKDIKKISHIHGNHLNMRKVTIKSVLYLLSSNKFDKIYWVSRTALEQYKFKNIVSSKSELLVNVIDKNEILEKANEEVNDEYFEVVYLGRLSEEKNPLRVYEIMKQVVKNSNNNIKCAMIGDGILKNTIEEKIKLDNMQNNIILKGFVANPMPLLNNTKVLLMASIYEGTPMCVLEAMALGVPIVSTPTDGINDLIKNDVNGYVSNDNKELINSINKILNDDELRNKMKVCTLKKFEETNNIDKYKEKIRGAYLERKKS